MYITNTNKRKVVSNLMVEKLTGQEQTYQFYSALCYFLTDSECHSISFEGENWEDIIFYYTKNNRNSVKLGEVKFRSNCTWTLQSLFFEGIKHPKEGPFLQLWKKWKKRKQELERNVSLAFFTTGKLTKPMIEGEQYKIPEQDEIEKIIREAKQRFPSLKNDEDLTYEIFRDCFTKKDIFFSQTIDELKKKIQSFVEHHDADPDNLSKFTEYLQSGKYPAGSKISKNEFYVWMKKKGNAIQNIYGSYLQKLADNIIAKNKFKLVEDRTCTPSNKNELYQGKYTIEQILSIHSNLGEGMKIVTITGGMGMGKTTFMLQMLKKYLESHKEGNLPLFAELTQWSYDPKDNNESFDLFASFIVTNLKNKLIKYEINIDPIIAEFNNLCREIKTILDDIPTYLFIDALDEFTGSSNELLSLLDQLRAKGHKIFLTGRPQALQNLEMREEDNPNESSRHKKDTKDDITQRSQKSEEGKLKSEKLLKLKLDEFTDEQVKTYLRSISSKISLELVKSIAKPSGKFPELSYQNPLVLQAISEDQTESSKPLTPYQILSKIAKKAFNWYLRSDRFREQYLESNEIGKKILSELCEIHQRLAIKLALHITDSLTISLDETLKDIEYKEIIKQFIFEDKESFIFSENSNELTEKSPLLTKIKFFPHRMNDYFLLHAIEKNLEKNNLNVAIELLLQVAKNNTKFNTFIELLLDKLSTLNRKHTKLTKIITSFIENLQNAFEKELRNNKQKFQRLICNNIKDISLIDNGFLKNEDKLYLFVELISRLEKELLLLSKFDVHWYDRQNITTSKGSLTSLTINKWPQIQPNLKQLLRKIHQFENLNEIKLNDAELNFIPNNFCKLAKLKRLEFTNLQLNALPKNFYELSELRTLNLRKNNLCSLPENFSLLHNLQELNLSNNQLSSFPESISSLQKLRVLRLEDNQLSSLPESLSSLHNLQELYLYYNQLSSLPGSLSSLHNLRELWLSNNQLSSLPESLSSLKELRVLSLHNNALSSLPESIPSLKKLQWLTLSYNQLSSLPGSISSLKNLQELYLQYNQLSSLPESLSSLKNLRVLDLGSNRLSSLPESLSSLQELRVLRLDGNALSSLPESFASLHKLQDLRLSFNQLSSLPESISSLKNLQKLYLDGKLLSSLSKSMKSPLEKLRKNGCKIVEW